MNIKKIFNTVFSAKKKDADPSPGEIWILRMEEQNPFSEKTVSVVMVESGWILYKIGRHGRFTDSMKVSTFKRCYERVKNDSN